jgi:hypothetical protein
MELIFSNAFNLTKSLLVLGGTRPGSLGTAALRTVLSGKKLVSVLFMIHFFI